MRKIIVLCLTLMLAFGGVGSVYAAEKTMDYTLQLYINLVDVDGAAVEGVKMKLYSYGGYGYSTDVSDAEGKVTFNAPPGEYCLQELGSDGNAVFSELRFRFNVKGEIVERESTAEYKVTGYNTIQWTCASQVQAYRVMVQLDDSKFQGMRVDLMAHDGSHIKSWDLAEKGKLTAHLAPGVYTLREIIEINGYEIPKMKNIMVGSGTLVPVKPQVDPEDIAPSFNPEPVLPEPTQHPEFYYDKFQQWINNQ